MTSARPPDLQSYDHILIGFSAGKDSVACLLTLLEAGVSPSRIELHHHEVDGRGEPFIGGLARNHGLQAVEVSESAQRALLFGI